MTIAPLRPALFCPALFSLCLLTACGPEVSGSPKPPPEFGAVAGKLLGCPSMEGLYAWPPVDGEYAKSIPTNRRPWEGGRPVPVYRGQMQIKVEQSGSRVTIRSRMIRPASVKSGEARDWAYIEYGVAEFSCKSDTLQFAEAEFGNPHDYGGGGARRSFALARLKDGALAVGIKTVSTGRGGSLFSWGGQSYGSYDAPDKVFWSWSKLASLDPASN